MEKMQPHLQSQFNYTHILVSKNSSRIKQNKHVTKQNNYHENIQFSSHLNSVQPSAVCQDIQVNIGGSPANFYLLVTRMQAVHQPDALHDYANQLQHTLQSLNIWRESYCMLIVGATGNIIKELMTVKYNVEIFQQHSYEQNWLRSKVMLQLHQLTNSQFKTLVCNYSKTSKQND
eukprot:TRINITY_DN8605_c0_g1_i6.p1 TRINITY_DN8605_c0_g1~~TRINITY_DN8605_c0_g1_i6.p1  ORF type:complete len:175 (-),score=2.26 TRINITY_DN8605_c0_g1_i6:54-578(-)